jgi:hypothetical protein
MNRRIFLQGGILVGGVLALGRLGGFFYSNSGDRSHIKAQSRDLLRLIKEISQYDCIHFGEGHPNKEYRQGKIGGSSTIDDFVDLILPLLSNVNLISSPYPLLRTEYLPGEVDVSGKVFIGDEELTNLDSTGDINPTETPVTHREISSRGVYLEKSTKKIVRVGHNLDYVVRGLQVPVEHLQALEKSTGIDEARTLGLSEGQIKHFRNSGELHDAIMNITIRDYYLNILRSDMQLGGRLIIYGGAAHNDYDEGVNLLGVQELGIACQMRREFPGRYISVDIIKPSIINTNSLYGQSYFRILESLGVDNPLNLDELMIFKLDSTLPLANYVVFLPKREVLSKVVGAL